MHKPLSELYSTGRNQLAMLGKSPQKKKNTLYTLFLFFLLLEVLVEMFY